MDGRVAKMIWAHVMGWDGMGWEVRRDVWNDGMME